MSYVLSGPSSEHHGSISIPYEISIPKSDITLRSCQDQDSGADELSESSLRSEFSRVETTTTTSHLSSQRSNFSYQCPDVTSPVFNDADSTFESNSSSSSTTTTVTSWRRQSQPLIENSSPDTRNVTVRSTWRNRGAPSGDETARARGFRSLADVGSEDEAEAATTWRAYRATTFDLEETMNNSGGNAVAQKEARPSPAEVSQSLSENTVVTVSGVRHAALLLPLGVHAPDQQPVQ